jgi:hypothetical protein
MEPLRNPFAQRRKVSREAQRKILETRQRFASFAPLREKYFFPQRQSLQNFGCIRSPETRLRFWKYLQIWIAMIPI